MNFHRSEFVYLLAVILIVIAIVSSTKCRFAHCHNDVYTCFNDSISFPEIDHIGFYFPIRHCRRCRRAFSPFIFEIHLFGLFATNAGATDFHHTPNPFVIWFVIFLSMKQENERKIASKLPLFTRDAVGMCGPGRMENHLNALSIRYRFPHLKIILPKTHSHIHAQHKRYYIREIWYQLKYHQSDTMRICLGQGKSTSCKAYSH